MARLLVGERFREAAAILVVWGALVEGMRAAGGMVYNLGMAKVDTRLTIAPVAIGAIIAPLAVFYLGKLNPLHGTAAALALAGAASLLVGIRSTRTALPIRWPVQPMLRAAAASAPLAAGFILLRWLDPVPSVLVAFVGLAVGGLYLLGLQLWLLRSLTTPVVDDHVQ
jgi:O-antigen/teichoic acid export membrane protein